MAQLSNEDAQQVLSRKAASEKKAGNQKLRLHTCRKHLSWQQGSEICHLFWPKPFISPNLSPDSKTFSKIPSLARTTESSCELPLAPVRTDFILRGSIAPTSANWVRRAKHTQAICWGCLCEACCRVYGSAIDRHGVKYKA